jgi:hypothetical protein
MQTKFLPVRPAHVVHLLEALRSADQKLRSLMGLHRVSTVQKAGQVPMLHMQQRCKCHSDLWRLMHCQLPNVLLPTFG